MPKRYVWREGDDEWGRCFRDPHTNEPMPMPERDGVCCPMVHSDIKEYPSPIDGKMITSRSGRRYDLESNGCVEKDTPKRPRGYVNPKFAGKRGLPLREDWKEKMRANGAAVET